MFFQTVLEPGTDLDKASKENEEKDEELGKVDRNEQVEWYLFQT